MMKTIVFDFDGVIHSYKSGWQGYECIPDEPVEGIGKVLKELKEKGYEIVIVSVRCIDFFGKTAINSWLELHGLREYIDDITDTKPPALMYIDDRAICFDGNCKSLVDQIENFKPWWDKQRSDLV